MKILNMDMERYLGIETYARFVGRIPPLEPIRGIRDAARLKKEIPQLHDFSELAEEARLELLPHCEQHISRVSTDDYSISLELCTFLMRIRFGGN